MTNRIVAFLSLLFSLTTVGLTGCETHPFSGAAAMRIDVEVYKGPLSEEPETQWGGLWGLLDQTERGLIETNNVARAVFANKGFLDLRHDAPKPWPLRRLDSDGLEIPPLSVNDSLDINSICYHVQAESPWYHFKFWRLFGILDHLDHVDCSDLITLINDIGQATAKVQSLRSKHKHLDVFDKGLHTSLSPDEVRPFLQDVAAFAEDLKFIAFRWSIAAGAGASPNRFVRIANVTMTVATSEYANQLHARADALLRQLPPNGLDRRELPPGVALREVEPTDFVNLYEWLNADPGPLANVLAGVGSTADRGKMIERLFADHFWAKTNTVYASGRGKVAMAFIKDDVGNWSLKSFDNDPENLLKAYTNFSIETIKKAAEIAANGMAPGAIEGSKSAAKLLSLATKTAFGHPGKETEHKSQILTPLRKALLVQLKAKSDACHNSISEGTADATKCVEELRTLIKEYSTTVDQIATGLSQK